MAVAFRSQSSATTGAAAATSLVVNMPAGVQPGDMLIAAVTADLGSGVAITAPAGWNLQMTNTQSTNVRLSTYWRLADGTEPASYTWNFDVATQACGAILAYSGVHPFAPMARATASNGTAGTTLTPIGVQSSYIGLAVQVFGTRNTTAAASLTPAAGTTERVDTSTTASTFMNLAVVDVPKGFPVGGTNTTASTSSQAVVFAGHTFFLSDARPEFNTLGVDEITGGSSTTSVTNISPVAAFSTNYPNELLLCFVCIGKSVQTVTSITGASLTWEFVGRANTVNGSTEVWRTFTHNQLNRQAFTVNFSGTVTGCNMMLVGIRGADSSGTNGSGAIGNVVTGQSSAAAPSISLTTTRSSAWVWGAVNDPDAARTTITAGTGQTIVRSFADTTNAVTGWMQWQNALTPRAGTSVTINNTAPATDSCNILALEILPARKPLPTPLFFQ